jgi:hypothetical protein
MPRVPAGSGQRACTPRLTSAAIRCSLTGSTSWPSRRPPSLFRRASSLDDVAEVPAALPGPGRGFKSPSVAFRQRPAERAASAGIPALRGEELDEVGPRNDPVDPPVVARHDEPLDLVPVHARDRCLERIDRADRDRRDRALGRHLGPAHGAAPCARAPLSRRRSEAAVEGGHGLQATGSRASASGGTIGAWPPSRSPWALPLLPTRGR